jgi:hypothetical protein
MIERLLWLLKWLETKEGTQDEKESFGFRKEKCARLWLETNEGTQDDREIIKAQRRNPR